MKNYFAKNLKFLRKFSGLTQLDLSKEVGRSQQTITNWETGNQEPVVSDFLKLVVLFSIKIDDLLSEDLATLTPEEIEAKRQNFNKAAAPNDDEEKIKLIKQKLDELQKIVNR